MLAFIDQNHREVQEMSSRESLFKQKAVAIAAHERGKQQRASAITRAESDPDYQAMIRAEQAKRRVEALKKADFDESRIERGLIVETEAKIKSMASPLIKQQLDFLEAERISACFAISTRGVVKQNWMGGRSGALESNKPKIDLYLRELERARVETVALEMVDMDESEIAEALTTIRNSLPLKDFTTEEIQSEGVTGVAIASALANS